MSLPIQCSCGKEWGSCSHSEGYDEQEYERADINQEVSWPRTIREEAILKQGVELAKGRFNWRCFGLGIVVSNLFWAAMLIITKG